MNIRFFNARILTMEEGRPIFNGEVWVEQERIVYVGDGTDTEAVYKKMRTGSTLWDKEIDCSGNLLMPGFKNAHTHSGMTLLRSYADDLPLSDWLQKQVFPVEARLSGEDIYCLTKLAVLEYLTSGITAIFDMYLTPETVAAACRDMGMRCVQVGAVNNFSQSPELVEEMYLKLNQADPLLSYILGFHAEYTCSRELLEQIARLARKYQAPVFAHISETRSEVQECMDRYGMTPPAFLASLGMFEYGGGGFHCVHMTDQDMEIFREKGLYVITNPASNIKLASGIAPIAEYLKRDIPVAIGTDGPASNNCLDMFREMFLVTGLAKIREKDAAVVDASQVLQMATVNGARAMGLTESVYLKEGQFADLIMIDLNQPNMQPIHNIPKNLVYSGSKANVCMTMIHGRILYQKGQFFLTESPESIYAQCDKIVKRIAYNK